jgi:hypothetical protein
MAALATVPFWFPAVGGAGLVDEDDVEEKRRSRSTLG